MKMTLIDCAIVFAVANVMLAGIANKAPPPDLYLDSPICNPDKTAPPAPGDDPRCASLKAVTAPAQTPPK